ncbi:hypothetical protein BDR04DRAFT_385765 [Suillus decipiens]|nr:hypothetical protein BDR04DRAFT_385765 [Suillus decipiens]
MFLVASLLTFLLYQSRGRPLKFANSLSPSPSPGGYTSPVLLLTSCTIKLVWGPLGLQCHTTHMAVLIPFLCKTFFLNTPQHLALAAPLQPVSSTLRKHATTYPITATPSLGYWGIDLSMTCGSKTILSSTADIVVDTGTTFLFITSDACDRY